MFSWPPCPRSIEQTVKKFTTTPVYRKQAASSVEVTRPFDSKPPPEGISVLSRLSPVVRFKQPARYLFAGVPAEGTQHISLARVPFQTSRVQSSPQTVMEGCSQLP